MQVLRDPRQIPDPLKGASLALGNFDGVHRGHQAVLDLARSSARARGAAAGAMVFHPHPREFFAPDQPVFRITPLEQKLALFEVFGLDFAVVMPFDAALAATEAQAFVDDILLGRLGIAHAVAGFNFHFGKARKGSPEFLRRAGARAGFDVTIAEPAADGETPFSSSAIRALLEQGDVAAAARALGYWWFMAGEVIAGERRGRTLGFPTANLAAPENSRLRHGIYAARLRLSRDGAVVRHDGVASFGVRPTFGGGAPLLETYIFDFAEEIYGEPVEVELLGFIRPEEAFSSADDLVAQMRRDEAQARRILAEVAAGPPVGAMQRLRDQGLAG